jgi:hypothetical protein
MSMLYCNRALDASVAPQPDPRKFPRMSDTKHVRATGVGGRDAVSSHSNAIYSIPSDFENN